MSEAPANAGGQDAVRWHLKQLAVTASLKTPYVCDRIIAFLDGTFGYIWALLIQRSACLPSYVMFQLQNWPAPLQSSRLIHRRINHQQTAHEEKNCSHSSLCSAPHCMVLATSTPTFPTPAPSLIFTARQAAWLWPYRSAHPLVSAAWWVLGAIARSYRKPQDPHQKLPGGQEAPGPRHKGAGL